MNEAADSISPTADVVARQGRRALEIKLVPVITPDREERWQAALDILLAAAVKRRDAKS